MRILHWIAVFFYLSFSLCYITFKWVNLTLTDYIDQYVVSMFKSQFSTLFLSLNDLLLFNMILISFHKGQFRFCRCRLMENVCNKIHKYKICLASSCIYSQNSRSGLLKQYYSPTFWVNFSSMSSEYGLIYRVVCKP